MDHGQGRQVQGPTVPAAGLLVPEPPFPPFADGRRALLPRGDGRLACRSSRPATWSPRGDRRPACRSSRAATWSPPAGAPPFAPADSLTTAAACPFPPFADGRLDGATLVSAVSWPALPA